MSVHHFAELTWEEVRDLDRASAVAILPVGAVEAHGPHLPLGTDVLVAEGMARVCAEEVSRAGHVALILPPVWYTAADFADNFPGTICVDGAVVTNLVVQIATSLREQNIRTLAIANAHLDPAHLTALRQAADAAPEGSRVVFVDLTKRRVAEHLTEEFRSGACHAGRFEGSLVLAERPDLFRSEIAAGLEPNPASLSIAIREGRSTFEESGGPRAYFGWPAAATAEEGHATLRTLGRMLSAAILDGDTL